MHMFDALTLRENEQRSSPNPLVAKNMHCKVFLFGALYWMLAVTVTSHLVLDIKHREKEK